MSAPLVEGDKSVSGPADVALAVGKPGPTALSIAPYIAIVLILPAVVLLTYRSVYFQSGYLDPWIYTSLIHNYDDVLDRLGGTYYAARIGHILPATFFNWIFGEQGGFFAFRYFMLSLAGLAAFAFGARSYSLPIGVAAAAAAVCTPWLLLPYASDHYDGTSAVYLLVAYVLTFIPTTRKVWTHLAAGLVLGVGAHVNQLTLGVFATIIPAWLIVHRHNKLTRQLVFVLAGLAGFVLAYAFMLFVLQLTNPSWANGDPTLQTILTLLGGDAARWSEPLSLVLTGEYYYGFAPAIVGAFLLALAAGKVGSNSRATLIAFALLTFLPLAFYVWRALSQHGVMTKNFTLINLFPAGVLATATFLGEFTRGLGFRTKLALCLGFSASLLIAWLLTAVTGTASLDDSLDYLLYLGIVGAFALIILVLAVLNMRLAGAAVGVTGILFLGLGPYQQNEFAAMKTANASGIDGWDLRRGVDFLVDEVAAKSPPAHGRIGFWYAATPRLNSLQSAYLWLYTRAFPADSPGMPTLDSPTRELLAGFGTVMLLAESKEELDKGYSALTTFATERGEVLRDVDAGEYRGATWGYYYSMVDRIAPKPPEPATTSDTIAWADLSKMMSQSVWTPATTVFGDGKTRITTFPGPGGFSSQLDLPLPPGLSGPGRIRIWVQVPTGSIYVLACKLGDSSEVYVPASNIPPVAGGGEALFEFELPDLAKPTSLIFGNASGGGQSVAIVRAIEIAHPHTPAALPAPAPATKK